MNLKKIDNFFIELGLKRKINKKQTTYYDEFGAVVMLKVRDNKKYLVLNIVKRV